MNQPKIEDNIFQTAMRELSAMEMKEEVLLTISKLLLTRLAFFLLLKTIWWQVRIGKRLAENTHFSLKEVSHSFQMTFKVFLSQMNHPRSVENINSYILSNFCRL